MSFRFGWKERLHARKDFEEVVQRGVRLEAGALVLWVRLVPGQPRSRLGLVVPRPFGKAVERNRIKRRLREIFRLNRHRLTVASDCVLKPLTPAKECSYQELEQEVLGLWRKARVLQDGRDHEG